MIVGDYADRKKTGRNDNRAEFQKMLKDSAKGLFDAVIVWKIDRFGRNREEIAINKVKLRRNGVPSDVCERTHPGRPGRNYTGKHLGRTG